MRTQNDPDERLCKLDKIITFNGQGCSGKTTQSKRLEKSNSDRYKRIHSYELRRDFDNEVYGQLGRKDTCIKYSDSPPQTLYQVEVLGIPSLAWLTACFHWKVKPLQEDYTVVLDHYIGDFYADMLEDFDLSKFQCFVKDHLGIPHFKQGTHFYLDIDYKTYEHRWEKREGTEKCKDVNHCIFEKRCERYNELCELGYLERINAMECEKKVAEAIQKHLDRQ